MTAAQIIGGVALIVFGIRFLRKGLSKLFGSKLESWLLSMTQNGWKALLAGTLVGTVAPSSTGVSLLSVQMLQNGRIDAGRVLAVLLGANIGITITVQLIAFRIQDYAGLLIATGLVAFQFLKRDTIRGIGQCVLALGFIFLAMQLISAGARTVANEPDVITLSEILAHHPWLILFATSMLSIALQSSTATIGMGLALAASNLIGPFMMVPWILGTNLGIAITTLAAGWPSLEGRRLGVSNFLLKLLVSLPLIFLPTMAASFFTMIPGSFDRQSAMFYTLINVAAAIIGVSISKPLTHVIRLLIAPDPAVDLERPTSRLNERVLDNPSLALAHATQEALQMGDGVKIMLNNFWQAYTSSNLELAKRISQEDDKIDHINRELRNYLMRICDEKNAEESHWQLTLHTFSNELESVGDVIDRNLCDQLIRHSHLIHLLPTDEKEALEKLHSRVMAGLEMIISLLTNRNPVEAQRFLAEKKSLSQWCQQEQLRHYQRLSGSDSQIAVSAFFLDLFNCYQRINSHLAVFAGAFKPIKEK